MNNKIKWETIRGLYGQKIVGYKATVGEKTFYINRVDAIGEGIVFTVNNYRYIFSTIASAKKFVSEKVGA
jgi:hypothetical protein